MGTIEIINAIGNFGALVVIAGLFFYQNARSLKQSEKDRLQIREILENEKRTTEQLLNDERHNNTKILQQLANTNANMAKSLELLQQSNDRIENSVREHRHAVGSYLQEARLSRKE